jgi:hypothetical protein
MKQSKDGNSKARALIEKPSLAELAMGGGQSRADDADAEPSDETRIREARYVGRGHADGQDLDDWLAAEAAVGGAAQRVELTAVPWTCWLAAPARAADCRSMADH